MQKAIQAGITDPNLQQAAALDFIVTGDPNIVIGGQNAEQDGITTTSANVGAGHGPDASGRAYRPTARPWWNPPPEPVGGLHGLPDPLPRHTATTVDYSVSAPGAGYLDATALRRHAAQRHRHHRRRPDHRQFSVSVPAGVLGTTPGSALQVSITPTGAACPASRRRRRPPSSTTRSRPGTPADPILALVGGIGTLTGSGTAYTLNLGSVASTGTVVSPSLAIENAVAAGGNSLTGSLSATVAQGFTISGTGPLPIIAAATPMTICISR